MSGQNIGSNIANSMVENNLLASIIKDNMDKKGGNK
jgi:hypothetical protein